jgi:hypothetical protein
VYADVFTGRATTWANPNEIPRQDKMDQLIGHARRCCRRRDPFHGLSVVSCLLHEFAPGGNEEIFVFLPGLVADQPGRELDHVLVEREPKLLHEDKSASGGQGKDAHHSLRIGPFDEVPALPFLETKESRFGNDSIGRKGCGWH